MGKLTPMMAQYKQIKAEHQDCILMFRLGDFYEMFFEDAVEASKILQITLTSRNKGAVSKAPMCGIPFHALDNYLSKLTRAGKKVAICDQVTEPTGKGIVERAVARVVTPGTTFDDNILDNKANNYIVAIHFEQEKFGFAYADVTTGEFRVTELSSVKDLSTELLRINPSELIAEENLLEKLRPITSEQSRICAFPYNYHKDSEPELLNAFELKSLKPFGLEDKKIPTHAAGMLFEYLKETQKNELKHIQKINFYRISEFMPLDESCIRNLELFYTNRDQKKEGSLIWVLDQTVSSMGGRLMRNWLLHPLLTSARIEDRLNKIEVFVQDSSLLREMRESLNDVYDVERLLSRLSLGSGNARDIKAMQRSLEIVPKLKELITNLDLLKNLNDQLDPLTELKDLIERAIVDEAPATIREGNMINEGFNPELDELRSISTEGKTFIKDLQEREAKRTGINSLKVKFNKVFGYYIEISKANLTAVPEDYIRKQTLVNAERFITPELKEYEEKVLTAEDRIKELEYELFYEVRMAIVKEMIKIQNIAKVIATLDALSGLAFLAVKNNYSKPVILEQSEIDIKNGRHPVIEHLSFSQDFVPNDCELNENLNFQLITGPNMGGKSTYLRQVALIVLMAHIGCFVPAENARIGVFDRIFTRVGASDNLSAGESTFMVEMQEASYIVNNATEKSLIILDEIGRGTSTYDGVSIAWAIMEYIHDHLEAKTLFATHYHELIELADKLVRARNFSVNVRENEQEGVVFLYKVIEGGVDKSYGIEVAKLAGLPVDVIGRARGVLSELETKHIQKSKIHKEQIPMFEENKRSHEGLKMLDDISKMDIDKMTPLEAMQKLNEMKKRNK
jgi:DNA mismatch repair protein MutS